MYEDAAKSSHFDPIKSRALAKATMTPVSYDAGFIVLSYFISLIGCVTTLELLHRRTSTKGLYNWFLLIAACITMGGIGIWCMHFIGNRAIVLASGAAHRQIVYNAGFTALSFFLPILVLLLAFYYLGITDRASPIYVALSGFLTGTAVCGMHYVGQLGIANYACTYHVQNVIGAAIIAVIASLIALSVFFRLRETWTDSWWKRSSCAAILAGAVSGMHWTATAGTEYDFRGDESVRGGRSRVSTVVTCAVLSVVACTVLLAIAILRGQKIRTARNRAQQVVLACAYFDETGRVVVTPEGALPCQKITNHFIEKTFGEDELSRSHPTFTWVYRASRNWPTLKDLIPGMIDHLGADPTTRKYHPGHGTPSTRDDASELSISFSVIFKQLFCVAAQQLANTVHQPLESLGVLFEEPLETGAMRLSGQFRAKSQLKRVSCSSQPSDIEKGDASPLILGRGKYLFLNRQLNKADAAKFAALGYRFGSVQQVSELLAKNMQVTHDSILLRLQRMKLCAAMEHLPPPGVHLACFMLRPSVYKSFDILVPTPMQNQLPFTALHPESLNEWQSALLNRFDEWTIKEILKTLINESGSLELERDFRWALHSAIIRVIDLVGDFDAMMLAKFSAKQHHIPCRFIMGSTGLATCTLVTIRIMMSIHAKAPQPAMTYVPFSFFSAQQQVDSANPSHKAFARQVKMEFGYVSERKGTADSSRHRTSRRPSTSDVRFLGIETSRPTSLFRASIGRRSTPTRPSEEGPIVTPTGHDGKFSSEHDDIDTIVETSPGTLTDPELENEQGSRREDAVELMAMQDNEKAEEKASWASELFASFRL